MFGIMSQLFQVALGPDCEQLWAKIWAVMRDIICLQISKLITEYIRIYVRDLQAPLSSIKAIVGYDICICLCQFVSGIRAC